MSTWTIRKSTALAALAGIGLAGVLTGHQQLGAFWDADLQQDPTARSAAPAYGRIARLEARLDAFGSEIATLRARLEGIEFEVAALPASGKTRATVQALAERVSEVQADLAAVDDGVAYEEPEASAESWLDAEARELEAERRHFVALDRRVASQSIDADWAGAASAAIDAALLHEELSSIGVTSVDCRTDLCRVEIELTANGSDPTLMLLPALSSHFADMAMHVQPDGRRILYLGGEATSERSFTGT